MTTLHPPDRAATLTEKVEDPYSNKAVATALTTIITVGIQWAVSGDFQLDSEGITALGGAVATVLVYFVSNWKKRGV